MRKGRAQANEVTDSQPLSTELVAALTRQCQNHNVWMLFHCRKWTQSHAHPCLEWKRVAVLRFRRKGILWILYNFKFTLLRFSNNTVTLPAHRGTCLLHWLPLMNDVAELGTIPMVFVGALHERQNIFWEQRGGQEWQFLVHFASAEAARELFKIGFGSLDVSKLLRFDSHGNIWWTTHYHDHGRQAKLGHCIRKWYRRLPRM